MDSPDNTSVTVTTTTTATTTTTTSTSTSNSVLGSRKRVKLSPRISQHRQLQQEIQWRNPAQAKIYNRRLLDSLRNLTINNSNSTNDPSSPPPPPPPSPPPRAIKDAADSALAMTARGQSRWSRAILSRRWRMRKVVMVKPKVKKRPKKEKEKEGEGRVKGEKRKVRDRLRLLGHLVPGCRKVSTEDLLEETADYVAALELQVKAMKALSDTLSAAISVSGTDSSSPPADVAAASSHDN